MTGESFGAMKVGVASVFLAKSNRLVMSHNPTLKITDIMVFSVRAYSHPHSSGRQVRSPICANDGVEKATYASTEKGGNRIGKASCDHRVLAGLATWIVMEGPFPAAGGHASGGA